jgi:hypothetical protein
MPKKSDSRNENRGMGRRSRGSGRAEASGTGDSVRGYRKLFRGNRKAEGNNSRNGCFPKLFMLLLPFMAVGTYLLLRS